MSDTRVTGYELQGQSGAATPPSLSVSGRTTSSSGRFTWAGIVTYVRIRSVSTNAQSAWSAWVRTDS